MRSMKATRTLVLALALALFVVAVPVEASPSSVRFVAGGDSRTNWTEREKVSKAMAQFNPEFVIHTGDMVEDGTRQSLWDAWWDDVNTNWIGEDGTVIPVIPVIGNHEEPNSKDTKYFDQFTLPNNERWYSMDWGDDIHIVVLDCYSSASGSQLEWLENDLETHSNYTWQFVAFHEPPYVSGKHDPWQPALDHWVPLFDQYDVDFVFNGHEHNYQRSHPLTDGEINENGTVYVITGGWGAPLYAPTSSPIMAYQKKAYHFVLIDVSSDGTLRLQAKDDAGATFDELEIRKQVQTPVLPLSYPWMWWMLVAVVAVAGVYWIAVGTKRR